MLDSFNTRNRVKVCDRELRISDMSALAKTFPAIRALPFSLKILLENLLRHEDGVIVKRADIEALINWDAKAEPSHELSFHPTRVLLQDFTGVPAVADLAAMREAMRDMGGDPRRINPLEPVDLVIDHSVQVDHAGTADAFDRNARLEHERNSERYRFLRWGQLAFDRFRVVPPDTGIVHQVNLEYLAQVVGWGPVDMVYPDTLVGTDSHTTMVNALGVVGWGVGGIEAEAAMLGQPVTMLIPQVVGMKLTSALKAGVTATDLVLHVTQALRQHGVVGKFVEFFGPGLMSLSLADRATLANMAPEYGATIGFFPVDRETLKYLRLTNRPSEQVDLIEAYYRRQGLFHTPETVEPTFSDIVTLDLSTVVASIAGPRRPQDRLPLTEAKRVTTIALTETYKRDLGQKIDFTSRGRRLQLTHGDVVIAAITSCTNTSNPAVMLTAGLLAKRAIERGLTSKPWVKTSLAPGSKVVIDYLGKAGVLPALEALGFNLVGYGCTTCIGNSGPLAVEVSEAIKRGDLAVAAVLSGNRNFEGRINPQTRLNFLASPPLVVAYALAGTMLIDWDSEPVGYDAKRQPVFLRDLWPSSQEIFEAVDASLKREQFAREYGAIFEGDSRWRGLTVPKAEFFVWDADSTYVRKPPFFENIPATPPPFAPIQGARCLALLGDSVTTDHISPAGNIQPESPAAKYLVAHGVAVRDFNSYGARRGNHEVMVRGTFANIRIKNQLVPGVEGGVTRYWPTGQQLPIYDAAMAYEKDGTPLLVIAGAEYGTGSSRDWAAKGTKLLGVRAVIAKSFERIHRSNLVGMGVVPLQFAAGVDAATLGLTGRETFDIDGIADGLSPKKTLTVRAKSEDGQTRSFSVTARVDTPNEVEYLMHGGILLYVLRQLLKPA
jgi:aconitate hydratase